MMLENRYLFKNIYGKLYHSSAGALQSCHLEGEELIKNLQHPIQTWTRWHKAVGACSPAVVVVQHLVLSAQGWPHPSGPKELLPVQMDFLLICK